MDLALNPIAVVAAAAATFLLGGLWYSLLFAKPWQRLAGVTDEQLRTGAARIFVGSALLALVMATSLAAFIGTTGLAFGASAGLAVGVTWVAAALGINYLFERKPIRLWAINSGYNVLAFGLMGSIIGAIQG